MAFRLISVLLLFAVALTAQSAPEVELTAEPHYHLSLENSYVRVLKVEIPPGQVTLMHSHRHDYVYVVLGQSEISNEVQGQSAVHLKFKDGETRATDGGFAHIVRTTGATAFRNVTIELLQDARARKSAPPAWDEDRALHILEGGTQDVMFVKDGVRVSEFELRPGGMVPRHHHAGPHLLVAVTDLNLESDVTGKKPSMIALKAGEFQWVSGDLTHMLMNTGKQQAKFITLEFH